MTQAIVTVHSPHQIHCIKVHNTPFHSILFFHCTFFSISRYFSIAFNIHPHKSIAILPKSVTSLSLCHTKPSLFSISPALSIPIFLPLPDVTTLLLLLWLLLLYRCRSNNVIPLIPLCRTLVQTRHTHRLLQLLVVSWVKLLLGVVILWRRGTVGISAGDVDTRQQTLEEGNVMVVVPVPANGNASTSNAVGGVGGTNGLEHTAVVRLANGTHTQSGSVYTGTPHCPDSTYGTYRSQGHRASSKRRRRHFPQRA
mmetsp:Transcript_6744/g.14719  ORF Transcript_6744/g.14719 Transcript_6744/m.14719 type:complete len:254 (+) Transcript_6744:61-822(+)